MRRLVVVVCVIAGCFLGLHQAVVPAYAVAYAPGWNLVSGPNGSMLVGAVGNIYTRQPHDRAYESLPATAPLRGGWGYWAFFPRGGSLQAAPGLASYTVELESGEWALVGNPSAVAVALVEGADDSLVYPPNGDYKATTSIPVGQGAWVRAQGQVTVATAAAAAPPAAPQPLRPDPPATFDALKAVALSPADLPTHSLATERPLTTDPSYAAASYFAIWTSQSSGIVVSDALIASFSPADAHENTNVFRDELTNDPTSVNQQKTDIGGIGDAAMSLRFSYHDGSGNHDWYALIFRRDVVAVRVDVITDPGTYASGFVESLARIIDARLVGNTGATAAPPLPSAHLLQLSGIGQSRTPSFLIPAGSVQICFLFSKSPADAGSGTGLAFALYPVQVPTPNVTGLVLDSSGCRVVDVAAAGQYYISVGAASAMSWSLTVDID
jgi:hypothetical protein